MINFKIEKCRAFFECEMNGEKEIEYVTEEQAEKIAVLLLEWVCLRKKETKIVIAGKKYTNED